MQHHHAKKRLGQHFLKSTKALHAMCNASHLSQNDVVLEIGPGKGILTRELLQSGARVVAVEKDSDLLPILTETFVEEIKNNQLTLIHGDVRSFDPNTHGLVEGEYKLVANIPYYITGEIISTFLEHVAAPSTDRKSVV